MKIALIIVAPGLATGCASEHDREEPTSTEPHFATHEVRPAERKAAGDGGDSWFGGLIDGMISSLFGGGGDDSQDDDTTLDACNRRSGYGDGRGLTGSRGSF